MPEPLILWKKIWTPRSVGTGRGFDPDAASSIRISDGIDGAFRHPSIGLHDEPVEDHSLPARFVRFAEYRKPTSVSAGDVMGFYGLHSTAGPSRCSSERRPDAR